MNTGYFIIWVVITVLATSNLLHILGKEYGEHVSLSTATRVAVFSGVATFVAVGLGVIDWLVS